MKAITKEEHIKNVPQRFYLQYTKAITAPGDRFDIDKQRTYNNLVELQKAGVLTKEKIDEAIGNDCWTLFTCDECNKNRDALVVIEISASEDMDLHICKQCLRKAAKLLVKKRSTNVSDKNQQ